MASHCLVIKICFMKHNYLEYGTGRVKQTDINPEFFFTEIRKFILESERMMKYRDRIKFTLFIPNYIMQIMLTYPPFNFDLREDTDGRMQLCGYATYPGYENKIIIAHKEYPLYKEDWMYHELQLS